MIRALSYTSSNSSLVNIFTYSVFIQAPLTKGYFAKNGGYYVNFYKMVQRHDARNVMRAIRAPVKPKVDPKVALANAVKKAKGVCGSRHP